MLNKINKIQINKIVLMVLLDQMIKLYSIIYIRNKIIVLRNFFSLDLSYNYGFSFSFLYHLPKETILLIHLIFLLFFYIFLSYKVNTRSHADNMIRNLLISGSFSNFIDRIFYGGVIDMCSLSFFNFQLFVCNIADIYLTIGVLLFFLRPILSKRINSRFKKYNIIKDPNGL